MRGSGLGLFVIPLLNTSGQPLLSNMQNRKLRERIHKTSLSRGNRGGEFDNRENLSRILKLRAEKAQLLGYENHAHYILENQTALSVDAVNQRLAQLAMPAAANVAREERFDLPVYHEDVRVFEIKDHNKEVLALFIADFYARPSKRGGAWMNSYVSQSNLTGEKPVIANHLNITKPGDGEPTLLTFDEVTTCFLL